ncbi:MAG: FTR1 family iron permease [Deltaproteobacteria bacterium]|jgi:high-affinity iron transporter|nr:FTR1 family iron permease [Deltaproteobacteria bacterium]
MKKILSLFAFLFVLSGNAPALAAQYSTWSEISDEMASVLNESYSVYITKDVEKSKELVNKAYFDFYEKLGVERAVRSYIYGKRASVVEYQFAGVKRLMTEGQPNREVRAALDLLIKMLREDASQLDGKETSGLDIFVGSLLILLREGFEAILVVAAIAAYLTRSGNKGLTRVVYGSAALAIVSSAILAVALQKLFSISGASQEMLEGFTMLLAVVVLFFVSNWMISKAESDAWRAYIEGKVASAVSTGSSIALAAAAFLAVFREGAETILFYQALMADAGEYMDMLWYGFALACVLLVAVFAVIRFGSLRLPLRSFFIGTSVLMYIMSVSFAGGGVKELQEADLIPVTPLPFVTSIDLLGIYPTLETLLPQIALLLLAAGSFIYYMRKASAARGGLSVESR